MKRKIYKQVSSMNNMKETQNTDRVTWRDKLGNALMFIGIILMIVGGLLWAGVI